MKKAIAEATSTMTKNKPDLSNPPVGRFNTATRRSLQSAHHLAALARPEFLRTSGVAHVVGDDAVMNRIQVGYQDDPPLDDPPIDDPRLATRSLRPFAALNAATVVAAIWIVAPVAGFRP